MLIMDFRAIRLTARSTEYRQQNKNVADPEQANPLHQLQRLHGRHHQIPDVQSNALF